MSPSSKNPNGTIFKFVIVIVLILLFVSLVIIRSNKGEATPGIIFETEKIDFPEPIIIKSSNFKEEFEKELPTYVPEVVEVVEVVAIEKPIFKETIITDAVIDQYVEEVCAIYTNIEPALVKSVIWHESRYKPNTTGTSGDLGLMQVITKWHKARMKRLGVTNLYDPYGNILVGVDYLSEIQNNTNDISLTLMTYNMGSTRAKKLHSQGIISKYALSVMDRAGEFN